jgi:hypothetical protein
MQTIYRVQSKTTGWGPFRLSEMERGRWAEDTSKILGLKLPTIFRDWASDGRGIRLHEHMDGRPDKPDWHDYRVGCRSLAQLRSWFSTQNCADLDRDGYVLAQYDLPDDADIFDMKHQTTFRAGEDNGRVIGPASAIYGETELARAA